MQYKVIKSLAVSVLLAYFSPIHNSVWGILDSVYLLYIPIHISYVRDNPIHCDCKIRWLPSFLSTVNQFREVTCVTPSDLRGTEVTSLAANQLFCGEFQ